MRVVDMDCTDSHRFNPCQSVQAVSAPFVIVRPTMMQLCAKPARIWSAVTCHRFCCFGDLSPKQGRLQRPGRVGRLPAFDGDKSPAESADESAHSKVIAASAAPLPSAPRG